MATSIETEAKFDAPPEWRLPDLPGLSDRPGSPVSLTAEYWDTEDLRLDRWGVTLRHRVADDDSEDTWTLKLPTAGAADVSRRREISASGDGPNPPAELRDLLTAMSRRADLVPVAVLRTDRRRRLIGEDVSSVAVELSDDRVTSSVAGRAGPAFRQIEVELIDQSATATFESVRRTLSSDGLKPSEDPSKLRRVLVGSAAFDERSRSRDRRSLEQIVHTTIGSGVAGIVSWDPVLRLDDDVRAVHRSRVAVRRLRSDLLALRPILRRRVVADLRTELKWFGGLLGKVRDLHVLRDLIDDLGDRPPAVPERDRTAIVSVLEEQLAVERSNLLSAMAGDRYVALLDTLESTANDAPLRRSVDPDASADRVVSGAGQHAWRATRRAHRKVVDDGGPERLHTLRKKAKKARMTAQLARAHGAKSAAFIDAAGALKDELGDLHDATVLGAWLDRHRDRLDVGPAYSCGRIRERAQFRSTRLSRSWPDRWDSLDHAKLRRWMTG